jgi:hypothetical protein
MMASRGRVGRSRTRRRRETSIGDGEVDGRHLSFRAYGYLDIETALGVMLPERGAAGDYEDFRRWTAISGIAAAEALENAAARDLHGVRVRAKANVEGPSTGGPGMLPPELLALVFDNRVITGIASIVAIAEGARRVVRWLESKDTKGLTVDDGLAVGLAFDLVFSVATSRDVSLVDVRPIRLSADGWEGEDQGYLVVLADASGDVYRVPVMLDGSIGRWTLDQVPVADADWDLSETAGPGDAVAGDIPSNGSQEQLTGE